MSFNTKKPIKVAIEESINDFTGRFTEKIINAEHEQCGMQNGMQCQNQGKGRANRGRGNGFGNGNCMN